MSSRKQPSNKLKHLSAIPTTVSLALVLVGFTLLVYLRSFVAFHATLLPPSSLPLDTLPLYVAGVKAHASTLENLSFSRVLGNVIVTRKLDEKGNSENSGEVRCASISNGTSEQDKQMDSEGQVACVTGDNGELKLVNQTELKEKGRNESSEGSRLYDGELEGLDLGELLQYFAPQKRRQWLKLHWSDVKILQSDDVSEQFAKRIKAFLKPHDSTACSLRFFMTWISPLASFGSRELLCLQSIFKEHPLACVVIISRSLDNSRGRELLQPFVSHGYRVMAAAPDLPFLFSGTAAQSWLKNLKKGKVDPGEISFRQNLSNILRLVALYKYGGIYLDNDVLVLKDFSNLSNVIGAQSEDPHTGEWYRLNNAVLVFDRQHPTLHYFIREFALTFNGSKWGHNGPYLATRVLKRLQQRRAALQCTVMHTQAFYPVSWVHIPKFFHRPKEEREQRWQATKLQHLLNDSYSIHLWNKQTGELQVERGSIIDELFHRQCVLCDNEGIG